MSAALCLFSFMSHDEQSSLLNAFRQHYFTYRNRIAEAIETGADTNVLARIGDDLDVYMGLLHEFSGIFVPDEHQLFIENVTAMQHEIRLQHDEMLDASHHGRPTIIHQINTGHRGRPSLYIDPNFLRWAYSLRSIQSIADYLGVHRSTVRSALIRYGIAGQQQNPFQSTATCAGSDQITSYTRPLSNITDDELDSLLQSLRATYHNSGLTSLDGMLLALGYRIPRESVRQSLMRVDPVQRVFGRITISRRVYSVPGPNSLWHHDGQHGLIRWGIVIHGFIDGYSRSITGLRASDNNRGATVLNLFLDAAARFGVPSRLRGDHGVENLQVAAWMEANLGEHRGSYIWGRSIHNIRIERLWVDVTIQVGAAWANHFTMLEMHHGLDINNANHLWLLHHIFLPAINAQLDFFAQSWNQHRIAVRGGNSRSPADMFIFDMIENGVRGAQLQQTQEVGEDDLEVFGMDWDALDDEQILESQRHNNPTDEAAASWTGRTGPPEHLNEVPLESPETDATVSQDMEALIHALSPLSSQNTHNNSDDIAALWTNSLIVARTMFGTSLF